MDAFQGGFQDIWLYIGTPLAGLIAFLGWKNGKAGVVLGAILGWLVFGALAYIDQATGESIARGAGSLLSKLLAAFGV